MKFSVPHAALVLAAGIAAAAFLQNKGGGFPFGARTAPALAYTDTRGGSHTLASPSKPVVVVLWVAPCAYCDRALSVLDRVRGLYREEDLDIVGFYLNQADSAAIDRIASDEGHRILMAQGQPTGEYARALTSGFQFRGPGRDIYVVGPDGRYTAVDTSDLATPNFDILQKVRSLMLNKYGLKERAG